MHPACVFFRFFYSHIFTHIWHNFAYSMLKRMTMQLSSHGVSTKGCLTELRNATSVELT